MSTMMLTGQADTEQTAKERSILASSSGRRFGTMPPAAEPARQADTMSNSTSSRTDPNADAFICEVCSKSFRWVDGQSMDGRNSVRH